MKGNKNVRINKILSTVFVLWTIICLIIVHGNLDSKLNSKLIYPVVVGYALFAFFLLLYVPIMILINLKKLKGENITKRLIEFSVLFVLFTFISFILDARHTPGEAKIFQRWPQGFGLAFGISFLDILFLRDKVK